MDRQILTNAHVVTPEWHGPGSVIIENQKIVEVCPNKYFSEGTDLRDMVLAPGCVDIHSDYLERELRPRPSAEFSLPLATHFMDQRAIACGLTTVFSAISFSEEMEKDRAMATALERAVELDRLAGKSLGRHYVHARLDPNTDSILEFLEPMKAVKSLTMVVYNDSIPGQRQYTMEQMIDMYGGYRGIPKQEAEELLQKKVEELSKINNRPAIMEAFHGHLILGSHDDTTTEHVDEASQFGATLCEMPTTIEAARRAKEHNQMVCMGAPNYVRGGSHCGNLACSDAMLEDLVDIICSDYHFPSMLGAAIKMTQNGIDMSRAFDFVSRNPAELIGLGDQFGSIEAGKSADLIAFSLEADFAKMNHVWVDGTEVYRSQQRMMNHSEATEVSRKASAL